MSSTLVSVITNREYLKCMLGSIDSISANPKENTGKFHRYTLMYIILYINFFLPKQIHILTQTNRCNKSDVAVSTRRFNQGGKNEIFKSTKRT